MKYGFLDREPPPDSLVSRRDPRAKLLLFFGAAVVVSSEPPGALAAFPLYFLLIATAAWASRASPGRLARRCLLASPFILMAAALPLTAVWLGDAEGWRAAGRFGASVVARAYGSVLLLILLTVTSEPAEIVWALRRLRAPGGLSAILTLMYRHLFILVDEWRRVTQARECRGGESARLSRSRLLATQIGMVFVRAWERAERVQAAMMARGFTGSLPLRESHRFAWRDGALAAGGLAVFLAVRLAGPV